LLYSYHKREFYCSFATNCESLIGIINVLCFREIFGSEKYLDLKV